MDEMIPETDVDDTQCSEQIVDVPVLQIAEETVEVVHSIPLERIPERIVAQIVDMHVPQVVEKIIRDSENRAAHRANSRLSQDRIQQRTVEQVVSKTSRSKTCGGEEAQDHQHEGAEKEFDHPGERSITLSSRSRFCQLQHTQRSCCAETVDAAAGTNIPEGAKDY